MPPKVTWIIIIAVVVIAWLLLKRLGQVSPTSARAWHSQGALVIDVRTEAEFQEQHLPGAVNIPLDRLGDEIARHAPNKEQPLLLHCRSGARSGRGTSVLRQLGYSKVFNLGSYGSAAKIVGAGNAAP
ncbi:MAG TPA: rhodanese-like domain-containing protein [Candidatus Paceibacterota bacterium]|nr:rhodanese-like domain-containing protein [Verrucomicrobiota bacterium]HSA08907.1 rhodanese-like domain-containing protein [Candidatus Paceibacterota bacterium]